MLKTVSTQLALASDTLSEILANGNTSGPNNIIMDAGYGINGTLGATTPASVAATTGTFVGHLLVGGTGDYGQISSQGDTTGGVYLIAANSTTTGDSGYAPMHISKFDTATTTSQYFLDFTVNNRFNASGRITANGAGIAAFASWSDVTLKENIETLPDQYNNIRALRPVEFDYIEAQGGGHQIGFIAQEMQEVYPCCVGEDPTSGKLMIAGWSKTEARLVSALQSAMDKIEALTARLDALEGAN